MPSCDDCGVVYDSVHDLQRHVKEWCPVTKRKSEEKLVEPPRKQTKWERYDDVPSDDSTDEDDGGLEEIIDDVLEKLEGDENNEVTVPDLRKAFVDKYKDFLNMFYTVHKSPTHQEIMDELDESIDSGVDLDKAVRKVLKKYEKKFDDIIDGMDENEDDEESDDDENEEESNDDKEDENNWEKKKSKENKKKKVQNIQNNKKDR